MPIVILAVVALFGFLLAAVVYAIENFFALSAPFWSMLSANFALLCAAGCFIAALLFFVYLKPHPAEKHFHRYSAGKISRRQAIESIGNTMWSSKKDIPPAYKSKILEKRIQALRKRVKAETGFLEDLREYMKARGRGGR